MLKRLKEQTDALTAFVRFCNEPANIPLWSPLTAFANGLTKLDLTIAEILLTASEQEQNNKGITKTKKETKTEMANQAVAVAEGLQAYSVSVNNSEIYFSMNLCFSTIMKSKDAGAISMSRLVYEKASALPINQIEPFGISDTVLNLLNQSILNYTDTAPATRNVITNKTTLTKKCTQLVKEANTIMRKQLLKMGRQFKQANPDFYKGLLANAKVIRSSVHAKIRITAEAGDPAFAIAGAAVTISGTNLTGTTNAEGKCTLTNVPAGEREVSIRKDDVSYTLAVTFQRGHSVTRAVNISPAFDVPDVKEMQIEKMIT